MVDQEVGQVPLFGKSVDESLEITGRAGEVGLCHLHVMKPDHRVDWKGRHPCALSDYLPVDLAVCGDVNDHVVLDVGRASQPLSVGKGPFALIVELDRPRWR
jgi:hypothetical protein